MSCAGHVLDMGVCFVANCASHRDCLYLSVWLTSFAVFHICEMIRLCFDIALISMYWQKFSTEGQLAPKELFMTVNVALFGSVLFQQFNHHLVIFLFGDC